MKRSAQGFSIIELLVVSSIIGILAATAVPVYREYREQGMDAAALADITNAARAVEHYYNTNESYPTALADISASGFSGTPDVTFLTFTGDNSGNPATTGVVMHVAHVASRHYYALHYPLDSAPKLHDR